MLTLSKFGSLFRNWTPAYECYCPITHTSVVVPYLWYLKSFFNPDYLPWNFAMILTDSFGERTSWKSLRLSNLPKTQFCRSVLSLLKLDILKKNAIVGRRHTFTGFPGDRRVEYSCQGAERLASRSRLYLPPELLRLFTALRLADSTSRFTSTSRRLRVHVVLWNLRHMLTTALPAALSWSRPRR